MYIEERKWKCKFLVVYKHNRCSSTQIEDEYNKTYSHIHVTLIYI